MPEPLHLVALQFKPSLTGLRAPEHSCFRGGAPPPRRGGGGGGVGVKGGRSSALKPVRLGLNCKSTKCSDAGTVDLSVQSTHETSPCLGDAGSKPLQGKCCQEYSEI